MIGDLFINKIDAYTMGVAMGSGFIAGLKSPASLKDFVENENPKKDGKEVIYPDKPNVAARDLTLTFIISGETPEEHIINYDTFIRVLYLGKVDISVPEIGDEVYHLTYAGNSGSYNISGDRLTSQLTVKFNEPNPANRSEEKEE